MPDMGYMAIKKALLQVKEICKHGKFVTCPFHKTEEETGIPYCPMNEDEYGMAVMFPMNWVIDDWKEDAHETE